MVSQKAEVGILTYFVNFLELIVLKETKYVAEAYGRLEDQVKTSIGTGSLLGICDIRILAAADVHVFHESPFSMT